MLVTVINYLATLIDGVQVWPENHHSDYESKLVGVLL